MYTVIREIHFSYGHRLLEYAGKCRHLHGHNGRIEIEIRGDALDRLGMVMDFDEIKRRVEQWISSTMDHKMLMSSKDPFVPFLKENGEPLVLLDGNPTAENIARMVYEHAKAEGLPVVSVRLWETPTSSATYRGT
jgi:6-pyruvoyltetrahydropterin/6-carboxytetrahydropterin synthase